MNKKKLSNKTVYRKKHNWLQLNVNWSGLWTLIYNFLRIHFLLLFHVKCWPHTSHKNVLKDLWTHPINAFTASFFLWSCNSNFLKDKQNVRRLKGRVANGNGKKKLHNSSAYKHCVNKKKIYFKYRIQIKTGPIKMKRVKIKGVFIQIHVWNILHGGWQLFRRWPANGSWRIISKQTAPTSRQNIVCGYRRVT